jgi:hypothetical protein
MRRRKLVAVLGSAVLVAVGAFVLWPRPDRITRENCGRIELGMSLAQVEIIAGAPGDYQTGPTAELPLRLEFREMRLLEAEWQAIWFDRKWGSDEGRQFTWQGDVGELWVVVGEEGVRGMDFTTTQMARQSPLENLLWRAKRLWRRWFPE